MELNEKTIKSRDIFNGKIVKLRLDTVKLPNGNESMREIIEHRGAVAVVAVNADSEVYLVRQFRKPIEQVILEIPAGTREENEDSMDCARRELEEETGLTAAKWEPIVSYYSSPGFCNELLHLYLATDLTPGSSHLDRDEFLEPLRVPLEDAYKMIFAGKIVDGKSIIGLQYAYYRLCRL